MCIILLTVYDKYYIIVIIVLTFSGTMALALTPLIYDCYMFLSKRNRWSEWMIRLHQIHREANVVAN